MEIVGIGSVLFIRGAYVTEVDDCEGVALLAGVDLNTIKFNRLKAGVCFI